MIGQKLIEAAGSGISTGEVAEAIDFDGTNDYLSRSSDLTGNADGKTFTFSFWVWSDVSGLSYIYTTDNTTDARVQTWISTTQVGLYMKNSSGTVILNASATVPNNNPPKNTWINVLWSIDLASTSNRSCYINDVLQSTVSWDTYTNASIDFTQPNHNIAGGPALGGYTKARLSNIYLDKTYRNLSVEANRRLFVTADLKPAADQASLNPILYLPMDDPTAPGTNAGTGGDFTLTGTVARSGRGPNQYNAPYSDLDGSADYLSRASAVSNLVTSSKFTLSTNFFLDTLPASSTICWFSDFNDRHFSVVVNSSGILQIRGWASDTSLILNVYTGSGAIITNRNYNLTVSIDLTNTSNRHFFLNGVSQSVTWATYTNDQIQFLLESSVNYNIGREASSNYLNGKMGRFWLISNSYIDLSVADNLAKFVTGTGIDAKPVDLGANGELPTGSSPPIYLPMYGNNAGKNYGTGGDFTVYSGPYTGARGPNEFWGNKANFNGTTGYLSRTSALSGVSDGKTVSGSFFVIFDTISTNIRIFCETSGTSSRLFFTRTAANALNIVVTNSAGTNVLSVSTPASTFAATTLYSVHFCFDLTNAANRYVYVNGISQSLTVNTYTNDNMYFSGDNWVIGALYTGTYQQFLDGKLSEFYFTTEYIDFSQEANRLKFRDAFGNPVDLTQQIEDAAIPNPAIYMRFDPASFGTNSGTGGDFTVNGTITDAGQL